MVERLADIIMHKNNVRSRSRKQFVVGLRHSSAVGYITGDPHLMAEYPSVCARLRLRFTVQSLAAIVTHGSLYSQATRYSCLSFRHLNAVCTYN